MSVLTGGLPLAFLGLIIILGLRSLKKPQRELTKYDDLESSLKDILIHDQLPYMMKKNDWEVTYKEIRFISMSNDTIYSFNCSLTIARKDPPKIFL